MLVAAGSVSVSAAAPKAHKDGGRPIEAPSVATRVGELAPTQKSRIPTLTTMGQKTTSTLRSGFSTAPSIAKQLPYRSVHETTSVPELRGIAIYNTDESFTAGLYSYNGADGSLVYATEGGNYGAIVVDENLYCTYYYSYWFWEYKYVYVYNYEEGTTVNTYEIGYDGLTRGQAIDPTTGTVYAITYTSDASGMQLATIDYGETSQTVTKIADIEGSWNGLACDATGQLYGISYTGEYDSDDNYIVTGSTLCKIDKTTGAVTTVGETGMLPQYISSCTIDSKTGKMYWNVCTADDKSYMTEVNLSTGAATVLYEMTKCDEIMGLFVPAPLAEDGAPAAAENLTANFVEGSLSGTLSFDTPTKTFDGTAASGNLTYKVLANGVEKASGSTLCGATVTCNITVDEPGSYKFVVTTANSVGTSPKAKLTTYIGNGVPEAPVPTLTYTGSELILEWPAITTTVDGGYIDASKVTYNVYDQEGNLVAENLATTTWSKAQSEPDSLETVYYEVETVNATRTSAKGTSNTVVLGYVYPPYSNDFSGDDALAGFTTIDANGDGKTWALNTSYGRAYMKYNSSLAMDDYLILPPLMLEGGKIYHFTLDAWASSSYYPERFEVLMGTQPTVAGLTKTVVAKTDLTTSDVKTFEAFLQPETSGKYYVAIHGISDADEFYLYIDNLEVGSATTWLAPGTCTDITVEADNHGALEANLQFTAPTVCLDGSSPLGSISTIEIYRDGESVYTFNNPSVGETLTYCDNQITEKGEVVYSFVASNVDGEGIAVESESVFVGFNVPAAPTGVSIVETANEGEVTVSWEEVTTDCDGKIYGDPSGVTYAVCYYDSGWYILYNYIAETSYTFQAVEEGTQQNVQYAVFAFRDGENGTGTTTEYIPVGKPYDGVVETFADGAVSYNWLIGEKTSSANSWSIYDNESLQISDEEGNTSYLEDQNGDNGYSGGKAYDYDEAVSLISGKISLANTVSPGISLWTFVISELDANLVNVYVREYGTSEWTLLNPAGNVVSNLGAPLTWANVTLPLGNYKDKVVQVRVEAVVEAYNYTLIDNIKVGSILDYDLTAGTISAPASVKTGNDFTVNVEVENYGSEDAGEFTVKLYADGAEADTQTVSGLESYAKTNVMFNCTMSPVAEAPVTYTAEIVYTEDQNNSDNATSSVSVSPKYTTLPAITDLSGADWAQGVKLIWSEPVLESGDGTVTTVTEDFEDAGSWSEEVEGWTFIDEDGAACGGFQGIELPNVTIGTSVKSFFVFERDEELGMNDTFAANSGTKYLAALFRYDDGTTSDWAISPTLSGNAQTVSFYAKSYSTSYPEKIEVYYGSGTTTGDFPADNKLLTVSSVPGDWTLYSVEIPAGATNFAIHSCATGSFMLMVDDVTYEAGSATSDLSIVGYDIYRDSVKITDQPVGECEYLDTTAPEGMHKYNVVVVYNKGLSAPSNTAEVHSSSGLDELNAGYAVEAVDGAIVVTGAEGSELTVSAVNGQVLYSGTAEATTKVPVANGVYLVQVDADVVKVIVK